MKQLLISLALLATSAIAHATLPPDFHNVPLASFRQSIDDFQRQGLGPAAFSICTAADGDTVLVSGAFDTAHFTDIVKTEMGEADIGSFSQLMSQKGYAPRDLSVAVGKNNQRGTLFSAIYTKIHPATASSFNFADADFPRIYTQWVNQGGYRVSDHIAWVDNGVLRHSMSFAKDGQPFQFLLGLDFATFKQKAADLGAQGWELDNFNVAVNTKGNLAYSGIWLKKTHAAMQFFFNMSPAQYQQHFVELGSQGYHVKKVFGYGQNGASYAAIWIK